MTLFWTMVAKAAVVGLLTFLLGRELFPANPKGPLYRWFGKANHDSAPTPPETRQRLPRPDRRD